MSSSDLILAIDNGSQSLRALVFDLRGQLQGKARIPFGPYQVPYAGWAERDPEIFWQALCEACHKLWREQGIDPARLLGVGVTTQRATVINLDRDRQVLRPAILWQDQRTSQGLAPVGGIWGTLFKLARVGHTIDYFRANAECIWQQINQPKIWDQTDKLVFLSGYMNYRLTGNLCDSIGSQVGYVPFDYKRLCWSRSWDWQWQVAQLQRDKLVELQQPGSQLGEITAGAADATGIPRGLPVMATASDKACEVLGSGALAPHVGSLSFGTAATVNITSQKYLEITPFIPPYPAGVPGHYCPEIQLFRGFWMVEWFKREFGEREMILSERDGLPAETHLESMIREVPAGCGGLMLQPFWAPGLKDPGPEARGAVLGFNDTHGRPHLYRALLEGLAYALREGKERIENRSGIPITSLRVSGGGAQSDVAVQITADVFGMPTTRPHTFETSGLGAALITAVGLGLHPDFPTASREMTTAGRTFDPNPANHRLYDDLYREIYLKMYGRLKPLYQNLKRILG